MRMQRMQCVQYSVANRNVLINNVSGEMGRKKGTSTRRKQILQLEDNKRLDSKF